MILTNVLHITTSITSTDDSSVDNEISEEKQMELRILGLFQHINALGNYASHQWFIDLDRSMRITMFKHLVDIWMFRAELSQQTKREICPPHGNPFGYITMDDLTYLDHSDMVINNWIICVMENFVLYGINIDKQILGAYYVLGALTMVSQPASEAMPWMYESLV